MATSSRVQLSPKDCGVYHLPGISAESAAKGSELLQENHDHHHIFFNQSGFHSTSSPIIKIAPLVFYQQWIMPRGLTLLLGLYTIPCIRLTYMVSLSVVLAFRGCLRSVLKGYLPLSTIVP